MKFVTLEEVIKFAVEREDDAYKLYKHAAEITTSISARKMFEELATEEAGHKVVFSKFNAEKAAEYKKIQLTDMKISQYLVNVPFKPNMTYQEILIFAMKAEEAAYKLYEAAAAEVEDPKLKNVLLVFADVEKAHKLKIENLYDEHVLTEG
ncbi:MAG: ferritin family protein [Desulfuromonadales bacterium]|nr:ferritin family protein [Desulfuromonadales bacterium]